MLVEGGKGKSPSLLLSDRSAEYWYQSQTVAFRIALVVFFVIALIPSARTAIFGSLSVVLPIIVAMAFFAFEILLTTARNVGQVRDEGRVLDHPQELIAQFETAFSSQRLTLDAFTYSSETIHGALAPFFNRIVEGRLKLKQLHIRLLVRDYTRPFVIPCDDTLHEDEGYRSATVNRNRKFIDDFKADINQIKDCCPDADIEFEVRLHPFEPVFKGVILNGTRAYWNLYPIMNARRLVGGKEKTIWDYYGDRTRLVQLNSNGPIAESELLSSFAGWFETVWDHFSRPVQEIDRDVL